MTMTSDMPTDSARMEGIRIAIAWLQQRACAASDKRASEILRAAYLDLHNELRAVRTIGE